MLPSKRNHILQTLALIIVYVLASKICLNLETMNGVVASIWLPTGLSLAAVVLYGEKMWVGILIGDVLVNLFLGAHPGAAMGTGLGNVLEALLGAAILRRFRFSPSMERFRDVVILVVGAASISSLVSACVGVSSLFLDGTVSLSDFWQTWVMWWIGDVISDLIIAPLVLVWMSRPRYRVKFPVLEAIGSCLVTLIACLVTFDVLHLHSESLFARAYTLFPLIFWIAFRFGPRGAATATFFIGSLAVYATSQGMGPFLEGTVWSSFRHLQVFLLTISVTGLAVAAVICERRVFEEKLSFLSEAGRIFGSSSDFQSKLNAVARMCVPFLADWCLVDILTENQTVHRAAVVTAVPDKQALAHELQVTFPADLNTPKGIHEVIRSGTPILMSNVTDAMLLEKTRDAQHMSLMKAIGIRSSMIVPLKARGKSLGAITLLSSSSGRIFTEEDFAFVQELERRTAGALDNAKLLSEAQTANRAKDDFLAALSHELRTPLNVILGWVQVLKTEMMGERAKAHALDTLERNAQIQVKLINDLLDVSRIVAHKFQLEKKPMDLKSVVATAVESHRMTASAKGIDLQFTAEPYLGFVSGDTVRLQQVIGNLLTNAIKFTPPEGQVKVQVKREGQSLTVTVADNGQGIDPQFLPFVFEAFRQEEGGASRAHGGLGLGLSIVRHIVQLHGGSVFAHSEGKNKGACFTIQLPLLAGKELGQRLEHEAEASRGSTATSRHPLEGVRVLLVDDSPDLLLLISHWLSHSGAIVFVAKSAQEALEILSHEKPDVILSDIGMPGEDGYQLIQKIRSLPPESGGTIPAAAITAYAREEEEQKALISGFQLHLPKPINGKTLVDAVTYLRHCSVKPQNLDFKMMDQLS